MISPIDALTTEFTEYESRLRELQAFAGTQNFDILAASEQQRIRHQTRVLGELTRIVYQRISYYKAFQNADSTLPTA